MLTRCYVGMTAQNRSRLSSDQPESESSEEDELLDKLLFLAVSGDGELGRK